MKEIELIEKRGPKEKHFLREDGTIIARIYQEDIHDQKNGKFEEIDNTLLKKMGKYTIKKNAYQASFAEQAGQSLATVSQEDAYLEMKIKNAREGKAKKGKGTITYHHVLDGLDVTYLVLPTKVKETMTLYHSQFDKITFVINTNLTLETEQDAILAKQKGKTIFQLEKPYMIDALGKRCDQIFYTLKKINEGYEIDFELDRTWLEDKMRAYPVSIDPTITSQTQRTGVYDTYIFPGDTSYNRGDKDILKAGVERVNGQDTINRTLIKFDLPTIGTGSEIVAAYIDLTGYPSSDLQMTSPKLATMHRITTPWQEETASWDTMHDKYEAKVESIYYGERSHLKTSFRKTLAASEEDPPTYIEPAKSYYRSDITSIVKKWYRGTPNYGLLIKAAKEVYDGEDYPAFFSKNNTTSGDYNPMPLLEIVYRNQNGLESYLNYKEQTFTNGQGYVNTFNGNLTTVFDLGSTIGGTLPASVRLIYNTNDVVLNKETIFGKGYRLSLLQTIRETTIGTDSCLEYTDEDGTIHYFYKEEQSNLYRDEDGLSLSIEKGDHFCSMKDKAGTVMTFTKRNSLYYLTMIKDVDENTIQITYSEENNITMVTDKNGASIKFSYDENHIQVVSPDQTTDLYYTNGLPSSLVTIDGPTVFTYNEEGLLENITDMTGLQIAYEYYRNTPYRVQKVTQYGKNHTKGQFFTLDYGFETTSIIDHKGRCETLIFNANGNLLSTTSMQTKEDIDHAYSTVQEYGNEGQNKNKILSSTIPVRYIKNYLKNTSFEQDLDSFIVQQDGITKSFDEETVHSGYRSLKLVSTKGNQSIEQSITVPKGKYYTFSGYFQNDQKITIALSYRGETGKEVSQIEEVLATTAFTREDVTLFYDTNAMSDLKIKITLETKGTLYLDDIQLEEGEVANGYNLIEDSDFKEGLSSWTLEAWAYDNSSVTAADFFEIVDFNNNQSKALKVKMNPLYGTRFSREFPLKGKKDDVYNISFWYKNEGIPGDGMMVGNAAMIYFKPVGKDADYCILPSASFHPNENNWQYFTFRYRADEDYEAIKLVFSEGREVNDFYMTNLSFYKELTNGSYQYDDRGNLIATINQSKEENKFQYDRKNQLIKAIDPKGTSVKFEYDNHKTNRVLNTISTTGLTTEVKYDSFGNAIATRVSKKIKPTLTDGFYRIRLKGTNKYVKAKGKNIVVEEDACSQTIWKLEKIEDTFKFTHSILGNLSLAHQNDKIILSRDNQNTLFTLEPTENGSYQIIFSEKDNVKHWVAGENQLETSLALDFTDASLFYIEQVEDLFISQSATYSSDGRFLTSITDSNFNTTTYDVDPITGLTTKSTNAKGVSTNYTYDAKKQITSAAIGDKTVHYTYNDQNLLSKIIQGNKRYGFEYDDFLNKKKVTINEAVTLVTNEYEENNGNLKETIYGNNQKTTFDYDDFDRIKAVHQMDDTYDYKYDNNGNLAKILSNDHVTKYYYDISKRLYRYRKDLFKIDYTYDANSLVTHKKYRLKEWTHLLENQIDEDNKVVKTVLDDVEIQYLYDSLGRIKERKIGPRWNELYQYVSNGKRTSDLVKSIQIGSDQYRYRYDALNNLTDIYKNNIHEHHYEYDLYNELILEKDFRSNEQIEYTYDASGNLLTKKRVNMQTDEVIKTDTYQYENANWEDQLTSYNNKSITYDSIGNPLTIGSNVTMRFINGRSLSSYQDSLQNLNVSYQYNEDGIRERKIVNNVETNYFLEGNDIIYEQRGNNIIYYLYDLTGPVGMQYNGDIYYYVKNLQKDITGILNSNYEPIVYYEYDSWGKVVSIKDVDGNDITESNHIGTINPFRYRSYYYDVETKLYYLNSRYYNPEWGRFLNGDNMIIQKYNLILENNLYIYSYNNPINFQDSGGHGPIWNLIKNKFAKPIERTIIGAVVTVAGWLGLSNASTLLKHSLQDKPKNLNYGSNSKISKDIKNSKEFKDAVKDLATVNPNANLDNSYKGLTFTSPDLMLGLQNTNMYISGQLYNGAGNLSITITHVYDFDYVSYTQTPMYRWPINVINNVAWIDQEWSYITPYEITIKFDYCLNC